MATVDHMDHKVEDLCKKEDIVLRRQVLRSHPLSLRKMIRHQATLLFFLNFWTCLDSVCRVPVLFSKDHSIRGPHQMA